MTEVCTGSPANMYLLEFHHFVTKVQGVETLSFHDFTKAIERLPDGEYCQITLVDLRGSPKTVSLMLNRQDCETLDCNAFDAQQREGSPNGWHLQELW